MSCGHGWELKEAVNIIEGGAALISLHARRVLRYTHQVDYRVNRDRRHWSEIVSMARTLDRITRHIEGEEG